MNDRAKLFEDDADDLDLSAFKPKEGPRPAAPDPEQVRAVSEAAKFTSREPKAAKPKTAAAPAPVVQAAPAAPKREPRRHRTGRTVQFNCRTTQDCFDGLYAIADQQGWLVGETLERAFAALKRELDGQGRA